MTEEKGQKFNRKKKNLMHNCPDMLLVVDTIGDA